MNFRYSIRHSFLMLLTGAVLVAGVMPSFAQANQPATTPEPNATPDSTLIAAVEMVGLVQAVTPGSITVNGQNIDISTAAMTQVPGVGTAVKVEGFVDPSGKIVAVEVRAIDSLHRGLQPGEIELVGPLTAMAARMLTVAGFQMDTTNAEIGPRVGLGALVKVHATLDAQGNWIVREIEIASANDMARSKAGRAGEFEITGTLTEVGDGYIVVSGRQIETTNAEIHGMLVPGTLVKVHLSLVNGEWVAREVEPAASGSDDDSSDDSSDHDESNDSDSYDSDDDHGSDDSDSYDSDDDHESDDSDSHDSDDDHNSDDSNDDD